MGGLDCEALALLVVPLESDLPADDALCWHRWDEAIGATPHGLGEDASRQAVVDEPFKRLPQEGNWPYFTAHVEQLLFPRGNGGGGRWLCCPDDLYLDLTRETGGPERRARVELLERLTTPLEPGRNYGLIHLSLEPAGEADAPDALWWGRSITEHRGNELSRAVLRRGRERVALPEVKLIRALVEQLFGDPHRHLERNQYAILMAQCPADQRAPEAQEEWRRALAKHRLVARASVDNPDREHEARQTVRVAAATGLVLGRTTAFTLTQPITGNYARNFRSYWAESIVFGLMQQDALDEFQRRLAAIGDPLKPDIEDLHRDWLLFRNVMWWSQLSPSTDVPQELVSRLRDQLGTERLFTDLEGDLATYSSQQHRRAEDRQAAALANLQVYGSGIVVLGALATIIGLFAASGEVRAVLVAVAVAVSVGVSFFVSAQLSRS